MSELIYGKNTVREALQNGRVVKAYVLQGHDMIAELDKKRIPYKVAARRDLDKMSNSGNHQGILAEVKEFTFARPEDMLKDKNGLIVVLDGLKDVHNLGAIIRTCECAGADGIVYKKHNAVKVNDTVAKVACGALENVKIAEVTNLVNTLKYFKDNGYWIVGSDGKAKQGYDQLDYDFNTVLIIGSEGEGMSRLVKEECDYMVKLPLLGSINSLNASVSAGILIYEVLEKRGITI